jgi:hypothetical protein
MQQSLEVSVMLGRIDNELMANRVKEMLSDDVHDVISRRHTNTSRSPSGIHSSSPASSSWYLQDDEQR